MEIRKSIEIDRSADDVWAVVGHDFENAADWMGIVHRSYAIEDAGGTPDAPVAGRVCELSDKPGGLQAREVMTHFDDGARRLTFEITPVNAPVLLPVRRNVVDLSVEALGAGRSRVHWVSRPQLKPLGRALTPLLGIGFGKTFATMLDELKAYVEARPVAA